MLVCFLNIFTNPKQIPQSHARRSHITSLQLILKWWGGGVWCIFCGTGHHWFLGDRPVASWGQIRAQFSSWVTGNLLWKSILPGNSSGTSTTIMSTEKHLIKVKDSIPSLPYKPQRIVWLYVLKSHITQKGSERILFNCPDAASRHQFSPRMAPTLGVSLRTNVSLILKAMKEQSRSKLTPKCPSPYIIPAYIFQCDTPDLPPLKSSNNTKRSGH